MKRVLLVALVATGCRNLTDPAEGQQAGLVGGKGPDREVAVEHQRLAPALGVFTDSAQTQLGEFLYTDCDGVEVRIAGGTQVDLRSGTLIQLQPGDWCGLQVDFQQPVSATGTTRGGISWELELDVVYAAVGSGVPFKIFDDRYYVFELAEPEWFRAYDLEPEDTGVDFVKIEVGHPSHGPLSGKIALRSALIDDADGNMAINAYERTNGIVARGPDRSQPAILGR